MSKLAWIDLETTGLRPHADPILEVALIVTDANLETLTERSWVVRPSIAGEEYTEVTLQGVLTDYVREMHEKSGLLAEIWSGRKKSEVEDEMLAIMSEHFGRERALLAGSSPHFDHGFINKQLQRVDRRLSYRHLDVSVFERAAELWKPEAKYTSPSREPAHRALDDIRWSIACAKHYRELFLSLKGA